MAPAKKVIQKKREDAAKAENPDPPLRGRWMSVPKMDIDGLPPGLEFLFQVEKLIVEVMPQEFDLKDERPYRTRVRYQVFNGHEKQTYFAFEEANNIKRKCGFKIHITDHVQRDVLVFERPFKLFMAGYKPNPTTVTTAQGSVLGSVSKKRGHHYVIQDQNGIKVFDVTGKNPFPLTNPATGMPEATIERLSAAFPFHLPWKTKALVFCAIFVVYYHEFDKKK